MYNSPIQDQQATITIRPARAEDGQALRRLAQLDSAPMPRGGVLVAAVGEELRAAISTENGEAISNPFQPSAELVRLLSERMVQLRGGGSPGPLWRLRRRGPGRPSLAPQPAGTVRVLD